MVYHRVVGRVFLIMMPFWFVTFAALYTNKIYLDDSIEIKVAATVTNVAMFLVVVGTLMNLAEMADKEIAEMRPVYLDYLKKVNQQFLPPVDP